MSNKFVLFSHVDLMVPWNNAWYKAHSWIMTFCLLCNCFVWNYFMCNLIVFRAKNYGVQLPALFVCRGLDVPMETYSLHLSSTKELVADIQRALHGRFVSLLMCRPDVPTSPGTFLIFAYFLYLSNVCHIGEITAHVFVKWKCKETYIYWFIFAK